MEKSEFEVKNLYKESLKNTKLSVYLSLDLQTDAGIINLFSRRYSKALQSYEKILIQI